MNEQKNKQQQPQHGNKQDKDMNQQGQKSNKQKQDTPQGKEDKHQVQGEMNQPNQPDKRTEIDDNPDETKKKIPNMENKH